MPLQPSSMWFDRFPIYSLVCVGLMFCQLSVWKGVSQLWASPHNKQTWGRHHRKQVDLEWAEKAISGGSCLNQPTCQTPWCRHVVDSSEGNEQLIRKIDTLALTLSHRKILRDSFRSSRGKVIQQALHKHKHVQPETNLQNKQHTQAKHTHTHTNMTRCPWAHTSVPTNRWGTQQHIYIAE